MNVEITAKQQLAHGEHDLKRGESTSMNHIAAEALERRGLIEIKSASAPENKMAADHDNKSTRRQPSKGEKRALEKETAEKLAAETE